MAKLFVSIVITPVPVLLFEALDFQKLMPNALISQIELFGPKPSKSRIWKIHKTSKAVGQMLDHAASFASNSISDGDTVCLVEYPI
jgi:hypothetical protein